MIGPAGPNDAAMFDIDDTLIWTNGQPNVPIIHLLHKMRVLGYKIVIITARPGFEIAVKWTHKNNSQILELCTITWDLRVHKQKLL